MSRHNAVIYLQDTAVVAVGGGENNSWAVQVVATWMCPFSVIKYCSNWNCVDNVA